MDRIKSFLGFEHAVNWNRVYAVELARVLNYFRFHGVADTIAEDLTASTFEKAWRARQSYDQGKSSVSTWLYTIAHHVLIDHFRATSNEQTLDSIEDRHDRANFVSLEESAQVSEDKEHLRHLLLLLPERERELIALKYGAEMSNRAIAKQTGLSETNVGTILHRIVASLRRQMEEEK